MFNTCVKCSYEAITGKSLQYTQFGKPTKMTFDYMTQLLENEAELLGFEKGIDKETTYMIGDNPSSDIKGGKDAGWNTILVKTGVYQGNTGEQSESDSESKRELALRSDSYDPTLICDNVEKALDHIIATHC